MRRLKDILIKVLEVAESDITDDMSPKTVATWDSFNSLMLVSELESVFQVKFTMAEVTAAQNVRDIKEALRRHGVEFIES